MAIPRWYPSLEPTYREKLLLDRLKRTRKLFRFLREHRRDIFDDDFQDELASMYRDTGAGKEPVPPALLAMATLLQGYVGASDAEAVELTVVDLRWQMVLGQLGQDEPAFSQGALSDFRWRLIASGMDKRFLERTVEVAKQTRGFDARKLPKILRLALDSAPLQGAGRVEDTVNLLAHAARKVVVCAAWVLGRDADALAKEAGVPLVAASSAKAGLDRAWSEPGEKKAAVVELCEQIDSLRSWLEARPELEVAKPPLAEPMQVLDQIAAQDLEPDPDSDGAPRVRKGVAPDRRISVEDGQMRHGRKSQSRKIEGYKRHVAKDLDSELLVAGTVRPANEPESRAAVELVSDAESQGQQLGELFIDRGYVTSPVVDQLLERGGEVVCRPWRHRNGELYTKHDFDIDLAAGSITCPAGVTMPAMPGTQVRFDAAICGECPQRSECTKAKPDRGRSVHIAKDEALQQTLQRLEATEEGRRRLRQRVPVEHSLAHVVYRQGHRARYFGARANQFDLRRACAIHNLQTAHRWEEVVEREAA